MFTVTVRDRVMIAHSLRGEDFGPAQRLHGATYVVEASFRGEPLDDQGVLVDIGRASAELRAVLAPLDYRNLDDEPAFQHRNSTTEAIAREVADRLVEALRAGRLGTMGDRLRTVGVTLRESDIAWASYERAP